MADENEGSGTDGKVVVVDGDRGGGGGGVLAVILLLIVLGVLVYVFREQLGLVQNESTINVPNQIDINVNVPM